MSAASYKFIVVDRRSTEAHSLQIYKQIKEAILLQKCHCKVIDCQQLSQYVGVSEEEAIIALEMLVKDGIFYKGKNSKYHNKYREVIFYGSNLKNTLIKHIEQQGFKVGVEILHSEPLIIDESLHKNIKFDVGREVIYQHRIYYGDEYPKAYVEVYFDKEYEEDFKDVNKGIFEAIGYPDKPLKLYRRLNSTILPKEINLYLNQPKGTAGLVLNEYLFDNEKIHSYAIFYFPAFLTVHSKSE